MMLQPHSCVQITSNELQTKLGHAHQKSSNCANDFGDKQQAAKYLFKKSGVCGEHNTVIVEWHNVFLCETTN